MEEVREEVMRVEEEEKEEAVLATTTAVAPTEQKTEVEAEKRKFIPHSK